MCGWQASIINDNARHFLFTYLVFVFNLSFGIECSSQVLLVGVSVMISTVMKSISLNCTITRKGLTILLKVQY